jgi:HicA toxin of bacterial toxin-antitoxin,
VKSLASKVLGVLVAPPLLRRDRVTIAGKPSDDLPPGTLNSIFKQAGWKKGAN